MRPSLAPLALLTEDFVASLGARRARDEHGLFVAEGIRFLLTAADSGAAFAGLVVSPVGLTNPLVRPVLKRCEAIGVPILRLRFPRYAEVVARIRGREPGFECQGVLGVFRQPWEGLGSEVSRKDLWIGVESVQSPGNLGTILRAGDAVGASGLIVFDRSSEGSGAGVDPFDPSAVRATMGSVFRHRFVRTTHREFRRWGRLFAVGATPASSVDYRVISYRRPTLIMLGDERKGLSEGQVRSCDTLVRIPMVGSPDSLNVAIAGAVMLYEAHNQRHPVRK